MRLKKAILNLIHNIRQILWQILGFDYETMLNKTDYTLLKSDPYTSRGSGTYDNGAKVWRWTAAHLTIGKYCSIAYDVNFILDEGYHKGSSVSNFPFINNLNLEKYSDITIVQREGILIGHDVWIGMGAIVMPGVAIGNGAIIAANAVVTKDVADFAVVAGSPAKFLKFKFDDETREKLNSIAWWEWDPAVIKERIPEFYQNSSAFIEKYYS